MGNTSYIKAERIYQSLQGRLLPRFRGKILAIEPNSRKYLLGKDELAVALKAEKKFPGKKLGFFRVGYPAVHKVRKFA